MAQQFPEVTLYFLGASRAIRIAWLLEELTLPYNLVSSQRAPNGLAPPEFKAQIPTKLGKSPTIKDGSLVIQESGAIVEYLCETYDTAGKLLPKDVAQRAKVREWVAAAEATFMIHALAILYARWRMPNAAAEHLPEMERGLSVNVRNDLDWLEAEVKDRGYLVGEGLTAADVMMGFSIEFILARKLGTEGGEWPGVRKWLENVQRREAYTRAVEKTGYSLK